MFLREACGLLFCLKGIVRADGGIGQKKNFPFSVDLQNARIDGKKYFIVLLADKDRSLSD